MKPTVLIVDDEPDIRIVARLGFQMFSEWRVLTANSGAECLAAAEAEQPDVILLDWMMPHMDGPAVIKVLKRLDPSVRIVAFSGLMDSDRVKAATGRDDIELISKPFTAETLLSAVHDALN